MAIKSTDLDQSLASRDAVSSESAHRATPNGTRRLVRRSQLQAHEFYGKQRGLHLSALGIGSYLGDCTDADDVLYHDSVRHAIACGVNVVDTASNYRCQRSERAIGRALTEAIAAGELRRDEVLVCTKGGYVALDGAPPETREAYETWIDATFVRPGILAASDLVRGGHCITPDFLAHQIEQSRRNLGVATIDVYYIHNPEEQLSGSELPEFRSHMRAAFELLEARASTGEIASYGVATWQGFRVPPEHKQHLSLSVLIEIAREAGGTAHHFKTAQLPINLAMPEAARAKTQSLGRKVVSFLDAAEALGVSVVASAALMQGKLTAGLPNELHALFPDCRTDAQRALRFSASLPGVSTVLAGMRHIEHVDENLGAWAR